MDAAASDAGDQRGGRAVFGLAGLAGFAAVLAGKNRELDHQRLRAEEREALAIDAVKKFRDAVQDNPELKNRRELDALRKALLKEPLEFFRALRDQLQSDRDTRPEVHGQARRREPLTWPAPHGRSAAVPTRSGRTPSRSPSWSGSPAIIRLLPPTTEIWPRACTLREGFFSRPVNWPKH